jgi:hypothetical protein
VSVLENLISTFGLGFGSGLASGVLSNPIILSKFSNYVRIKKVLPTMPNLTVTSLENYLVQNND